MARALQTPRVLDGSAAGRSEDQTLTDFFNKIYKTGLGVAETKVEGGRQ
jgi:hypothetical protein